MLELIEAVDQGADLVTMQKLPQAWITAGALYFRNLLGAGDQLEPTLEPGNLDRVRCSMGRNQGGQKYIAVKNDAHQRLRAQANASSTACSIFSAL